MKLRLGLLMVPLILSGCGNKEDAAPKLEAFPVYSAKAARRTLEETLVVTGSIKARNEATLFSRVPGKLKRYLLKEGDLVRRDQAVALVERDEVGVVFEPAPVPSTLTGVVGRTYLDNGENVTTGTPIALVVDDNEVIAKAELPERYSGRVRVGQKVSIRVQAYLDQTFTGEISRLSPIVDPATRSSVFEVTVANPRKALKSGMFAELIVNVARKTNAVAVPIEAVMEGSPPFVFVAKDGKAEKRPVTVGLVTDQFAEAQEGVEEGEEVITSGLFALQDGSPVEIITEKSGRLSADLPEAAQK